jgi:transcriptional regulator with XRE-family HTH domain
MDLLTDIGKRVRKTREHYGFTRERLAEMANISPQFLVHIENGTKSMTANTICNLARALNVSADYLLFGLEDTDLNRTLAMEALVSLLPEDRMLAERVLQTVLQMIKNVKFQDIG